MGKLSENNQNHFSFFETPGWLATRLAEELPCSVAEIVFDLGAGRGSLLLATCERFRDARGVAVDVDPTHRGVCARKKSRFIRHDIIKSDLTRIPHNIRTIEKTAVVSNPPYGRTTVTAELKRLMVRTGFMHSSSIAATVHKSSVFIARALDVFPAGTALAFIVPVTILTSGQHKLLRATLQEQHLLTKVDIILDKAFSGTETQTAVLYFVKDGGYANKTRVSELNEVGLLRSFECRPDLIPGGIHLVQHSSDQRTLGSINAQFTRGKSSAKSLRDREIPHIHSSDLVCQHKRKIALEKPHSEFEGVDESIASPGDILISRVGSRCLGKVALVESGSAVISDCVIKISVPGKMARRVFNRLKSNDAQQWLHRSSSGACAKILTYSALRNVTI